MKMTIGKNVIKLQIVNSLSVVYDISMHVFPTVPSPTTTHFIGLPDDICAQKAKWTDLSTHNQNDD